MASGAPDRDEGPWSARVLRRLPLEPVWSALALAGLGVASVLCYEYATGRLQAVLRGDLESVGTRALATLIVLIAYLPAAQLYLARWTGRHAAELGPRMRAPVFPTWYAERPSRAAGFVGVVTFVVLFLVVPDNTSAGYSVGRFVYLDVAITWVAVPILGWLMFRFAHAMVVDAARFSRLAAQIVEIELLDLRPLAPFVQQGLRSSLLMVILISISANLIANPGPTQLSAAMANTAASVGAALAALVLPVYGVHGRIREAKRGQLERLRVAIVATQAALLDGKDEGALRLPALIALEGRLSAVREWPFDAPSLLRFVFYLALGVGSWIGAAGVERLLDRVLS
jgi:hypothetical protein